MRNHPLTKKKNRNIRIGIIVVETAANIVLGLLAYRFNKKLNRAKADDQIRVDKARAESQKDVDIQKTINDINAGHEATKDAMVLHSAKNQDDIEKNHEKTKDDIDLENARTINHLRLEEARMEREQTKTKEAQQRAKDRHKERQLKHELENRKSQLNRQSKKVTFNPTHPYVKGKYPAFYDWFYAGHGEMPNLPPLLTTLIVGCPYGFDIPALFTCLSVLGAYCFSSLRADYHGSTQTPTIFVVIEGPSGSGKGLFEKMYKMLAKRFIEHDAKYFNASKDSAYKHIVQTLSVNITRAKYAERQYISQLVFFFIFCTEMDSLIAFLRMNGLGNDFFRHAFDNDAFEYDNCRKEAHHGHRPIFNNFVITGTPQTVGNFIDGKVENGDAPRFIWSDIPGFEFEDCNYTEPSESDMGAILDKLDDYQRQYTYYTDSDGNEVRCPDTCIDMRYVQTALDEWSTKQKSMYEKDCQKARPEQYRRISTIAFRCAMILHALWGFPQDEETRKKVVALTQYIADYIMERYVYKFGHFHNAIEQPLKTVSNRGVYKEVPEIVIADWVMRNKAIGDDGKPLEGYGTFAGEWNTAHPDYTITRDTVKRRMMDYRKRHPDA